MHASNHTFERTSLRREVPATPYNERKAFAGDKRTARKAWRRQERARTIAIKRSH